jgi:hypothetical protein
MHHTAPSSEPDSTHTSLKTTESMTNNNTVNVPYPPYSLDLAPCDFPLFPKLEIKLKGSFVTLSGIQRKSQAVLDRIWFGTTGMHDERDDFISCGMTTGR